MSDKEKLQSEFERWQEKMNMHEFCLEYRYGKVRIIKFGVGGEPNTLMADNGEFHDISQFTEALKVQNAI